MGNWARVALSIFLIIFGAVLVLHLTMEALPTIEGLLAIAAAILLLAGK